MIRRSISLILAVVTLGALGSAADTTITVRELSADGAAIQDQILVVGGGRLRLGAADTAEYWIFDTHTKSLTTIDTGNRSFTTLDKETFAAISGAVTDAQQQALAEMEERLKQLPPEQQAMARRSMESMMARVQAPQPAAPVLRHEVSGTSVVAGQTCSVVTVFAGDIKKADLYMVDPGKLGLDAADFATLRDFQTFMRDLAQGMPGGGPQIGLDLGLDVRPDQFPLQIVRYGSGGVEQRYRLDRASGDPIPPQTFAIPEGFEQRRWSP